MTTETLSLMGNSLRHPSLDVPVDVRRLQSTAVSMSSRPIVKCKRQTAQVKRQAITDLNYWIKLLSCIIEANGGHIGLSHINLHWYY